MKMRVMVVDDEPISAQSTSFMMKKNFDGLEVVGIFHSGREAVVSIAPLRPDIIIMDIRMPGINGLEAMRRILAQNRDIKFIMLSAYNEFEYAAEALSLGASDYLLKPVKQQEFTSSLQRIIETIESRKTELEISLEQQEKMQMILPIIRRDFIRSMMPGMNTDERLVACAGFLGYLHTPALMAVARKTENAPRDSLKRFADKVSRQIIVETGNLQPDEIVLYIPEQEEGFSSASVAKCLQGAMDAPMYCGVGSVMKGGAQVKRSMAEALSALQVAAQNGFDHVLTYAEARDLPEFRQCPEETLPLQEREGFINASSIIEKANRFIEENFKEDITLEDAATHVNLSSYYFSRFYKENAGMNFSDYLQQIRIEKAKEYLLRPDKSVKDIAYLVGYKDPSYFSRVFKKATGYTASDYKEMRLISGKGK